MIVILGMHRSGTSLVAQVLYHLGVFMGERILAPNKYNPYGHWEDLDAVAINEHLIWKADGNWFEPPPEAMLYLTAWWYLAQVAAYVDARNAKGILWGFKDPRTALTVAPLWDDFLREAKYIHVMRNRADVIASLIRRERGAWADVDKNPEYVFQKQIAGYGEAEWGALYDEYERRILKYLEKTDRPVMDVWFEEATDSVLAAGVVKGIADFIGVDTNEAARNCIK